jgi:hypothetical protein
MGALCWNSTLGRPVSQLSLFTAQGETYYTIPVLDQSQKIPTLAIPNKLYQITPCRACRYKLSHRSVCPMLRFARRRPLVYHTLGKMV